MSAPAAAPVREALAANRLFRELPPDVVRSALPLVEVVALDAEEVVFEEGASAGALYLVLEGAVRIGRGGGGGRGLTLAFVGAGDFFGEMALLDPAPRSAAATAARPSLLGRIGAEDFDRVLALAPAELSRVLTRAVVERVRAGNEQRIAERLRGERALLVGEMVGVVVHDLKNPLGVVLNAAELLGEGVIPPERVAGMLRRSADGMIRMVEELLEFARGGRVDAVTAAVSVAELVAELDEQALAGLEARGIRVVRRLDFRGVLRVDRGALVRALLNLVRNAGEAMPDGGALTLRVAESPAGGVLISVSDTGPGIPDQVLPSIFEPFATHGKRGGTGLGLATARAAVQAHGGEIRVRSRVGEGTTFEVWLPAEAAEGAEEVNGESSSRELRRAAGEPRRVF